MDQKALTSARLTTPPGKGGIAVITLCGDGAEAILERIFRPWKSHATKSSDTLRLGHLIDVEGNAIDQAVVHCRSGSADINIHGGPQVVRSALETLGRLGVEIAAHSSQSEMNPDREGGDRRSTNSPASVSWRAPSQPSPPLRSGFTASLDTDASRQDAPGPYGCTTSNQFEVCHPRWNNPAIGMEMLSALSDVRSELALAVISSQWSGGLSALARQAIAMLLCGMGVSPMSRTGVSPVASSVSSVSSSSNSTTETTHGRDARATSSSARHPVEELAASLREAAGRLPQMSRLLHPAEVVLAGAPNAGKSTLANALTGRNISIVHDTPGTTRDWVREPALVNGVPIWLTDTAGITTAGTRDLGLGTRQQQEETTTDWPDVSVVAKCQVPSAQCRCSLCCQAAIDAQAVERARARIARADLVVLLGEDATIDLRPDAPVLRAAAKCDLSEKPSVGANCDVAISAITGQGMEQLRYAIVQRLGLAGFDPGAPAAFTAGQATLLNAAADAVHAGDASVAVRILNQLLTAR